eukprot:SAG31_NODE_520_length_14616_cov_8.879005_16_plen_83_part_01
MLATAVHVVGRNGEPSFRTQPGTKLNLPACRILHVLNLINLPYSGGHNRTGTVVFREIETAVPDERILVLFVPYILLAISYNT